MDYLSYYIRFNYYRLKFQVKTINDYNYNLSIKNKLYFDSEKCIHELNCVKPCHEDKDLPCQPQNLNDASLN